MPQFSDEEKKILENYVTNVGGDIFAIKNLPGIVGAVYARYSRAKTGFQETLLKEFVQEGMINAQHASELIERVLIAYGDDSVGELEGAHISLENISVLATKEVEDRRIGGSPIEKSTRYIFFDEQDAEGNYKYIRPPEIMSSPLAADYVATMDFLFDSYKSLIEPMQQFYQELFPIEKAEYDVMGKGGKQKLADLTSEKDQKAFRLTHKIDLKTKACDTLRCLLPLSTKTNVGLFGNGRFYQSLISHLLSTSYGEVITLGNQMFTELSQVIPKYIHRAKPKSYAQAVDKEMKNLVEELFGKTPAPQAQEYSSVYLADTAMRNTEEYLLTHMLYQYTDRSFQDVYSSVLKFDNETRLKIKTTYVGKRETRRDRPGRALESGYTYTFDLCADFGTYKDLMRHRISTQMRQPFSPRLGMIIPQDLQDAGFSAKILACHERVLTLYEKLLPIVGASASYATLHGNRVRWLMGFNDRSLMHMLELRTTKQGHPQYRKLCQEMHQAVTKTDPWRASMMSFVDYNSYDSARGDSEARQRVKERLLEEEK
jgi:thymidylate synthase ThyX